MTAQPKGKPCNKGCGMLIHWDDNHVSKSGKKIPLEENGEPHQCPNALPYTSQYDPEHGGPSRQSYSGSANTVQILSQILERIGVIDDRLQKIMNHLSGQESL